jgi:RNA polymerase sporulation-specific sigma factor
MLDSIADLPKPLAQEEERELAARMKQGDKAARDLLIESYLRLVWKIVHKFRNTGQDPEELFQIGVVGLIKAVDAFDVDRGWRLSGFAGMCIKNEILMEMRRKRKRQMETSLEQPIPTPKDGGTLTLADLLGTDADEVEKPMLLEDDRADVWQEVDSLKDRDRSMIVMLYGLEGQPAKTQWETARALGVTQSYISRLEKRALDKIRAELNRAG